MSTYPFSVPDFVREGLDLVQDSPDVLHNILAIACDHLWKNGTMTCQDTKKRRERRKGGFENKVVYLHPTRGIRRWVQPMSVTRVFRQSVEIDWICNLLLNASHLVTRSSERHVQHCPVLRRVDLCSNQRMSLGAHCLWAPKKHILLAKHSCSRAGR